MLIPDLTPSQSNIFQASEDNFDSIILLFFGKRCNFGFSIFTKFWQKYGSGRLYHRFSQTFFFNLRVYELLAHQSSSSKSVEKSEIGVKCCNFSISALRPLQLVVQTIIQSLPGILTFQ